HDRYVNDIQVIDRLCHKNITQFFIGYNFVLALTQHNCLYGWGTNNKGQLGIANRSEVDYVEPVAFDLKYIDNKVIYQISCEYYHTLILTSDGCVYGWGYNRYGQLGYGPDRDIQNGTIFRVNFNPNHEIKSIYCCHYSSFAITSEGQVFSWGRNSWYNLGHNSCQDIWEPQLIADMTGIKTICSGVVSEVSQYELMCEELHSLGSGAFGEVMTIYRNRPQTRQYISGEDCKERQWLTLGWRHCISVLLEVIPQEWELDNTWHRKSNCKPNIHRKQIFIAWHSPIELIIYSGNEIYDKFIKLDQIIDSMCVPIHSTRPECSQYFKAKYEELVKHQKAHN
ncbi:unnamed protein product, partial [Oppiella nova]